MIRALLARILLSLTAWAFVAVASAHAHRMPEAYLSVEESTINGNTVAVVTVKLNAKDALTLVADAYGADANLETNEIKAFLAKKVASGVNAEPKPLSTLGVEVDRDLVFVYLSMASEADIIDSSVLSSVYHQWTNYVRDDREETGDDRVFTQRGRVGRHRH